MTRHACPARLSTTSRCTLPDRRMNVFILFAKTGTFTDEEVEACSLAQGKWRERVIMLGKNELEPYHVDERRPKDPRLHVSGLEDLPNMTTRLYPSLRCKGFLKLERPKASAAPPT